MTQPAAAGPDHFDPAAFTVVEPKSLLENLPAVGRTDLDLPGQSPGVSLM